MNIKALEEFLKSVPTLDPMINISDCDGWMKDGQEFMWAKGNGRSVDVYSGEATEGFEEDDEHLIVNLDCQMGYWMTEIFDKSKEMTSFDFHDKYEEFM